MGSPLSPVVANLYMKAFEEKALSTSILRPWKKKRYVDDTFVIWQHGPEALQDFHDHLNQQEPSIQFTMEQEEGKILDALVERNHNKLTPSVYHKPTHTDRYLHFRSHHHRRVLTGIVRCLKNRATKVRSKSKQPDDLFKVRTVFKSQHTLTESLVRVKQSRPKEERNEVVYEVPCASCDHVYLVRLQCSTRTE